LGHLAPIGWQHINLTVIFGTAMQAQHQADSKHFAAVPSGSPR
jgi:hypothetical protein